MRKIIFFLLALPLGVNAQVGSDVLQTSNALLQIPVNGMLFNEYANLDPGYEVPLGSDNHTLFTSSVWLAGVAPSGDLRSVGPTYCQTGLDEDGFCEYYPGPLKVDGSASTTEAVMEAYNRVWVLNREEVELHIAYFDCMNDPGCNIDDTFPDGYDLPEDFSSWPAHGDVIEGYAEYLAPFVDVDNDGVYDPESGDYPDFCGDYAAYLINNDGGGIHYQTLSDPIGLEMHTMVYAYASEGALNSSVYVRQRLINRGANGLEDTYLGIWSDFDIGNGGDDFVGTDVERGMVYAYNASAFDADYGDDLPAMGCLILNGPEADSNGIDDEMPYENYDRYGSYLNGWGDGVVDNETLGMKSSMAMYEAGPVDVQTPYTGIEFYHYLRGKWRTGAPMLHGDMGLGDVNSELLETRYVFPGITDPMHEGTDGEDPEDGSEGWTELTANNEASDRRILASMGPFTFEAGSEETIEYAYVFAQQSQDPEIPVLELLGLNADEILEQQCILDGDITTGLISASKKVEFSLYPNPSTGAFTLNVAIEKAGVYQVFNMVGQEIANGNLQFPNTSIGIDNVTPGMYFVSVDTGDAQSTKKIVIE